jgi:hypothetical protein
MFAPKALPPVADLQSAFRYIPETGQLFRRVKGGLKPMTRRRRDGYIVVKLGGRSLYAHRICWKLFHSADPKLLLDHVDGDRSNNRIHNLREATRYENCLNVPGRSARFPKGVFYDAKDKRYRAQIRKFRRIHALGSFRTAEEAHQAYCLAAARLHGDFSHPKPCTK